MKEKNTSFLVGYRKFIIAVWWMILSSFTIIMVISGLSPKRADVTTFALWVVGVSGFFASIFVGGNAVEYFNKFWQVKTETKIQHSDSFEFSEEILKSYSVHEEKSPNSDIGPGLIGN